jgi:hypothetical protein
MTTEKTYGSFANREALVAAFAEFVVEGMDLDSLVTYAVERLTDAYSEAEESSLMEEIEHFAPHLLEE